MKHIQGRREASKAELRDDTFTGTVWGDPLMPPEDDVTMNHVYFGPGGRTHWHSHERGQVLHVTSGQGWVARQGDPAVKVRAGDTVWTPPGEVHWHGAAEDALLVHVAITLGSTEWMDEVSEDEFHGSTSGSAGDGSSDEEAAK
ncbi:MAG: cupin domain-containing protein [Propionibacteriales bacterium]|nr:cupin domain-containing protein [Propionibacteriales bacterium]